MEIAIIGISCRLPGDISNHHELYEKLVNKQDCLEEHFRINNDKYHDPENNEGKIINKRGGYVHNLFNFDNSFFKISAKEAKSMDPQQRHLIELAYECMRDAKISTDDMKGTNTGVFVGSCTTEYLATMCEKSENVNEYGNTGGLLTLLSNRISYFFDLRGPSLTLDTACSSSGYALHLACQSLKNGESDQCLVSGANIVLKPEGTIAFSQATMLSPDGKCQSFDANANGYVRSEGFVTLMIKPLEKAIKDGNHIYSVIKNTGVNQDGKTPSITMPSNEAQMNLLKQLYSEEDIKKTLYIEAHGTGTIVGDKNEANAIGQVIGKNKKDTLFIGSIKSNIGHTEPTSGLASIVKICLIMKYNQLLPNIHFNTPSPNIDFDTLNLKVVDDTINFDKDDYIIGLNNFGFGGANFHCQLRNYVSNVNDNKVNNLNQTYHLLPIHGINKDNLENNIISWSESDEKDFMLNLYNQNNVTPLDVTGLFIIKNKEQFDNLIFSDFNSNTARLIKINPTNRDLEVGFVFCGQGPQSINMGYDLYDDYPIFKNTLLKIDELWKKFTNHSFLDTYKLFKPEYRDIDKSDIPINDPLVAQPALFFYQAGLIELYKSFGILPTKVIGHSAGELGAFYAAGAFNLEQCVKISYYRSIYQQKTAGTGNMLVIGLSEDKLEQEMKDYDHLLDNLEIACINDQNSIVLSGPSDNIKNLNSHLSEKKIFNVIIRGRCPFHSSLQGIIENDILEATKNIFIEDPKIPLISTVTGEEVTKENYKADYWWQNIRNKVDFLSGIKNMDDINIFVEIGPHPVLGSNIKNILKDKEILISANRKEDSSIRVMTTIADLWSFGYPIKNNFGIPNNSHMIQHIWDKENEFINEPDIVRERRLGIYNDFSELKYSKFEFSYMKDHIVGNNFVFPTVGYLDMLNRYFSHEMKASIIKKIEIGTMYSTSDTMIKFKVRKNNNKIYFDAEDGKINYFNCQLDNSELINEKIDVDEIIEKSNSSISGLEAYKIMKAKNFNFGNQIKSIETYHYGEMSCLIELLPKYNKNFKIHPTYLDSCLTSSVIYLGYTNKMTYLPIGIDVLIQNLDMKLTPKYVYTEIKELNYHNMVQDSYILDKNGYVISKFLNVKSANVTKSLINDQLFKLEYNKLEEKIDDQSDNKDQEKIKIYNIESNDLIELRKHILDITGYDKIFFILPSNHDGLAYGFVKSYQNENKNSIVRIIVSDDVNSNIIKDIVANKYETCNEYLILNNQVLYPELEKCKYDIELSDHYYLNIESKGNLNSLGFYPLNESILKNNYVKIDVKASALNFKDIMVSLNVVNSDYIGYELSGIVIESKSSRFKPGDEVFASPNKSGKGIANQVICDEKYVFKKPNNLDFVESASIGLIFGTSYICLIDRVNIKPGDTVLIHSALGGIGQASIQICKMLGATIIASAGTDEKRAKLKEYGIKYITNSRNPEEFKRDVLKFTNGEGVDVILNSLAGKSLLANLEIISKKGTIVEIGKRDILNDFSIPLGKFIDSISYSAVHFDEMLETHYDYIQEVMKKMVKLFEEKKLVPTEIHKFHISEAQSTLKYMSKGIHTGKLILEVDDWKPETMKLADTLFSNNGYYLITGGLGGLGIELINWMNNKGAEKFILMSRSGKINKRAEQIISQIKSNGGEVIIAKVDVSNQEELFSYFAENMYVLEGIFHLAGLIRDNLIENLTEEDIETVLKPKVDGTNNLNFLSQNYNLKYFVMFSSISALIGNPGQANYSAANNFMDILAKSRHKENLPGLSINVGAIGGTGMITNDIYKVMKSNGLDIIHYHEFFENMGRVLQDSKISNVCISNQDWGKIYKNYPNLKMLEKFKSSTKNITKNSNNSKDLLSKHIQEILEIDSIDENRNLNDYGVDSIIAMELSSWCKDELGIEIQQVDIIQGITINKICQSLSEESSISDTNNEETLETNVNTKDNRNRLTNHIKELLEIEKELDPNTNLTNYGVDSILAMEISNFVTQELGIEINQLDIMQGTTINKILNISETNTNVSISSGDNTGSKNNLIITRREFKKKNKIKEIIELEDDFLNQTIEKEISEPSQVGNYSNIILVLLFILLSVLFYFYN